MEVGLFFPLLYPMDRFVVGLDACAQDMANHCAILYQSRMVFSQYNDTRPEVFVIIPFRVIRT